jgi:DNA-directed RNA polymerase subunit RPC12/RpoP
MTSTVAGRASAMRRMRRRAAQSRPPYCATNGCASLLDIDEATGVAQCHICGHRRTVRPIPH